MPWVWELELFLSKALALRHQALSVYDKEKLVVVFAVQQ